MAMKKFSEMTDEEKKAYRMINPVRTKEEVRYQQRRSTARQFARMANLEDCEELFNLYSQRLGELKNEKG